MILRPVRDEDALAIFRWRNDAAARRWSAQRRPLSFAKHLDWFAKRLLQPWWYIGLVAPNDASLGVCRIDAPANEYWISVVIDPRHRGHGYGTVLIDLTTREVATALNEPVHAQIHQKNIASIRAFEKAGYAKARHDGVWLIYRKD